MAITHLRYSVELTTACEEEIYVSNVRNQEDFSLLGLELVEEYTRGVDDDARDNLAGIVMGFLGINLIFFSILGKFLIILI